MGSGSRIASAFPANEKLGIAMVGVANRAAANLAGVSNQKIVALCDVDDNYLNRAAKRFSGAEKYNDFRRMMDRKDIDAVVVSTPDHTHAVASMAALRRGRHVYCEKPLAHTVHEVRTVTDATKKHCPATQMGPATHPLANPRHPTSATQPMRASPTQPPLPRLLPGILPTVAA